MRCHILKQFITAVKISMFRMLFLFSIWGLHNTKE